MKKFTAALLCLLFILFSSTGCAENRPKNADKDFSYTIDNAPVSLDPLICFDEGSLSAVRALFNGLTRFVDGKLVAAAAKSWSSNDDYTVFTFTLREDLYWRSVSSKNDKTKPITAHDFVFAFQRAVNPETKSPHLSKFLCIKNSKEISRGNLSPEDLGVFAINDYTLEISLETSYPEFPSLLSSPAFSPCNKEFFESTKGKYALEARYLLTNGPFLFSSYYSWEKNSYIKLSRNKNYDSNINVWPKSLSFIINGYDLKSDDTIQLLLSKAVQVGKIDDIQKTEKSEIDLHKQIDTVWGLCFNTSDELMKEPLVRGTFVQTIDRNSLLAKLPGGTKKTDSIIPDNMKFMGHDYRSLVSESFLPSYNLNAVDDAQNALTLLGHDKIPSVSVLCLDDEETKALVTELIISWNLVLGSYYNMNPVSESELAASVKSGNYQIALCPISSYGDDAYNFLSFFSSQNQNNPTHLESAEFDSILENCFSYTSPIEACKEAEKYLNENFVFYPIYHKYSYYGVGPGVSGVNFFPFHTGVDFIHAVYGED